MDAVGNRLSAGRLDRRQPISEHRSEDLDHLPIAVVGAGKLAPQPRDVNGVPLLVVARNLGHVDIRTVEKYYGHLAPSFIAEAIRARRAALQGRRAVKGGTDHRSPACGQTSPPAPVGRDRRPLAGGALYGLPLGDRAGCRPHGAQPLEVRPSDTAGPSYGGQAARGGGDGVTSPHEAEFAPQALGILGRVGTPVTCGMALLTRIGHCSRFLDLVRNCYGLDDIQYRVDVHTGGHLAVPVPVLATQFPTASVDDTSKTAAPIW